MPEGEFQEESSEVVTWERWIEFLTGYLLALPYPSERSAQVDGSVLERIQKLLEEYFGAILRHMAAQSAESVGNSEEADVVSRAKIESLYVRGDAYPHQFYAFAEKLYGPHDNWFRTHYGFTIVEAIALSKAIDRLYCQRINTSRQEARRDARKKTQKLVAGGEITESARHDAETRIACMLHFGCSARLLGFTVEELSQFAHVPPQKCRAFIGRMAQQFGYRNKEFINSYRDASTAPWDFNTLYERPIVQYGDSCWAFVPPLLRSTLFFTFHFDLLSDETYLPAYSKARGTFLEQQTAECLRRLFPADRVLLNPLYPSGEEMADVKVLYDHKIVVAQCKSKALTYAARTGTDFTALRTDLKKAVADAFRQGTRARDYLQSNEQAEIVVEDTRFAVDMTRTNGLYIVSVTPMPLQTLTARFANTNSVLKLFSSQDFPWALSLGDLDILTRVLSSPAQFFHYATRRREVERTSFEIEADEFDYLGLYLAQGMYFSVDEFRGIDHLGIAGMSSDIDRWVFERFELGRDLPPPRSPMPNGFADFLRDVEKTASDFRTDCAMALLNLSGQGRKQFMEMLELTVERSKKDRSLHSFSVVNNDGKTGESFLCFDAGGEILGLFHQVVAFAMLKKYPSKCENWVGFGRDLASNRTVDTAFFASYPWSFDDKMEQMIRDRLRPGEKLNL